MAAVTICSNFGDRENKVSHCFHCFLIYFPWSDGTGCHDLSFLNWMWELDHKESWLPKNWCFWTVVLEKTLESPLDCKEIQPVHPKGNQSWIFIGLTMKVKFQYFGCLMWRTDSLEKTLMLEGLEVGGEGDDRGWDDWMASSTQWVWVWASFRRWWRTGKPNMLQSMGSQRVGQDWMTEQQ